MKKFFDSVDQEVLLKIISLRIKDSVTFDLLKEIIGSYTTIPGEKVGLPIGNLTSQIFANIYMNELDRFIKHQLKVKIYVRYGDDFVIMETDCKKLEYLRTEVISFLNNVLKLQVNPKSNQILKPRHGLKILGMKFWQSERNLSERNLLRINERLNSKNLPSYGGIIKKHGNKKQIKKFGWLIYEKLLASIA